MQSVQRCREFLGRSLAAILTLNPLLLGGIALAAAVRGLPEILSAGQVLGYDSVNRYLPFLEIVEKEGLMQANASVLAAQTAPLFYSILGIAAQVLPTEYLLKISGPALHVFLVLAMWKFCKKQFHDERIAGLAVLLTAVGIPFLRLSWDLYRNVLGLGILMVAFAFLSEESPSRRSWMFVGLATLAIAAHELMAPILVGIVLYMIFCRRRIFAWQIVLLGISLMATLYYAHWLIPPGPEGMSMGFAIEPLSFPENYLDSWGAYAYSDHMQAAVHGLSLLLLVGIWYVPGLAFRMPKHFIVRPLLIMLSIPAVSIILSPSAAIPAWHRWTLMLPIPLVIVAAQRWKSVQPRRLLAAFLAFAVIGVAYAVVPASLALPVFANESTTLYMPSSLLQGPLPLDAVDDVISVMKWFNSQLARGTTLWVHRAIWGYAVVYAPNLRLAAFARWTDVSPPLSNTREYTVIWSPNLDWHDISSFQRTYAEVVRFGSVAGVELLPR
jgi:hypothetical protein